MANPHTVKHFSTWLYQFQFETTALGRAAPSLLLPDAHAVIATLDDPARPPIESAIFFEWDRSTESRNILRKKATGYDEFYRSGAFARRCGGKREHVEDYPFAPCSRCETKSDATTCSKNPHVRTVAETSFMISSGLQHGMRS